MSKRNNPWPGPNNAAGPEKKADWAGGKLGAVWAAWSHARPGMEVFVNLSNMNRVIKKKKISKKSVNDFCCLFF